jgi:transglutaminase-like putative cysteine protease
VTYRQKLGAFAVAGTIAVAAVACGGDAGGGTKTNEATPTTSDSTFLSGLTGGQPRKLFQVEADHAEYWRIATLDRYDGESWTSTNPGGSEGGMRLSAPATLPRSVGGPPPGAETLDQTFRILSDISLPHALPMAQTAEQIAGPIRNITWDPTQGQAFIDGPLEAGTTYTVRSQIVVPTPEELDRVHFLAPRAYGRWTELPANLDPRIRQIAERWAAGATSDYRKVLAIQQHFHNGSFLYSTAVNTPVDAAGLFKFLTQTRVGFCQQYSSAMAVMVRALGLPARIGVGFRAGTPRGDGSYLVTTADAHVWVEVLFPGYGWLQFEPEPPATAPTPDPNAQPGTYLDPVPTDGS